MNKETFIKKWNPATLENEERLGTLESEFLKDVESLCNEIFSDGEEAGFEQARETVRDWYQPEPSYNEGYL